MILCFFYSGEVVQSGSAWACKARSREFKSLPHLFGFPRFLLGLSLRGLFHNHPPLLKHDRKANAKLTSKEATLLDYSEEGRALLSELSSAPLEGFATYAVDMSNHAGRKTVKAEDVKLASKQFNKY